MCTNQWDNYCSIVLRYGYIMRFNMLGLCIALALLGSIVAINQYSTRQDINLLADTIVNMLEVDSTLIDAFHGHIIRHQGCELYLEDIPTRQNGRWAQNHSQHTHTGCTPHTC